MSENTHHDMKSVNVGLQGSTPAKQECLSCRIIGTSVLAGTGSYAIWQSRTAAPGTPVQKRMLAGLGIVLVVAGVFRWRKTSQCKSNLPILWST
ncbi:hypothetical protein CVT24_004111 [Panaeolus cyanescens]|uniref:Distal membrane-arm assembly complex protein 1-like domain-containing protein n=1 Tax=Panaeolus cyanescens TaxID=181874 RepID=A0A409Y5X8_9AGAR|nr:hypothetical protein CVT24_004111 [Panaeolus cyanescens]